MAAPDTQDIIRTRELVLVDAEGRERARLGMSRPRGLPTLEFMDRAGRPRLCICLRGSSISRRFCSVTT